MLSMKAKYALRALIVMAQSDSKLLQTRAIAEAADVPFKFLETILQDLKHNGIVASKRGIFGGYSLARLPADISVGTVIRVLDGPLAPIRCASVSAYQRCDDCVSESACAIRKTMIDVRNAIAGVLDTTSLETMVKRGSSAI
ncbi:MAG: Rrf2 family transcriptional regulator [Alphaproteobacteria bacterium]|nr:Rrf2 family transcriptional regulator [Alphaproteobacteria bacterium]